MSVVAPRGFSAAGVAAGIKAGGALDMALVASEEPASAAAVFTTNKAVAAPVVASRDHLLASGGQARAVVLTAGNANAATGPRGLAAAEELCAGAAGALGAQAAEVLVCQTGLIGVPFPLGLASAALPKLVAGRATTEEAGARAAEAIMTTDTVRKEVVVERDGWVVGGMAKGAAMLAPDLATMLAVVTTDAACSPESLRALLAEAVAPTFNALSIDGCTSTNDTVAVLANGAAGPVHLDALGEALTEACASLAAQMAADAEGATLVARISVVGAVTDQEAHRAARRVADSLLVKCSFNGRDPYWGRVVSELGSAGVGFDPDRVSVAYGGTEVCRGGVAVDHDAAALATHMAGRHLELRCDLGLGRGTAAVLTTDLGYGYIDENRTTS